MEELKTFGLVDSDLFLAKKSICNQDFQNCFQYTFFDIWIRKQFQVKLKNLFLFFFAHLKLRLVILFIIFFFCNLNIFKKGFYILMNYGKNWSDEKMQKKKKENLLPA